MSRGFQADDDEARAAIHAILEQLPTEHPARAAYGAGADAITLTRLVGREDLIQALNEAWLDWYTRRVRLQARRVIRAESKRT